MRYLPPVEWDEETRSGVQLWASIRSEGGNFAALVVSLAQVESRYGPSLFRRRLSDVARLLHILFATILRVARSAAAPVPES